MSTLAHADWPEQTLIRDDDILGWYTADSCTVRLPLRRGISPRMVPVLKDALAKVNTRNFGFLVVEVELPYETGKDLVVETKPGDVIVLAQRFHKPCLSRCVLGYTPQPTNFMTVRLERNKLNGEENCYWLTEWYTGRRRAPEEDELIMLRTRRNRGRRRTAQIQEWSDKYWGNHAFVLEHTGVYLQTLKKVIA